jgi:hypothetical protein
MRAAWHELPPSERTVRAVATRLGISHEALYSWLRKRPKLAAQYLTRRACPRCGWPKRTAT